MNSMVWPTQVRNGYWPLICLLHVFLCVSGHAQQRSTQQGQLSQQQLTYLLKRSMSVAGLAASDTLTTTRKQRQQAWKQNEKLIRATQPRLLCGAAGLWGNAWAVQYGHYEIARTVAQQVHAVDSMAILQAPLLEIVDPSVEAVAVLPAALQAYGFTTQPGAPNYHVAHYNFRAMLYDSVDYGHQPYQWAEQKAEVPDFSKVETRMWFYERACRYIDAGYEAFHFGQVNLMNRRDSANLLLHDLLVRIRSYAASHARRGFVLCSGGSVLIPRQAYWGDPTRQQFLFDFYSAPCRPVETLRKERCGPGVKGNYPTTLEPDSIAQHEGIPDAVYGRALGGWSPQGWYCHRIPGIVELDNYGGYLGNQLPSTECPQPYVWGAFVYGMDEITWFNSQRRAYRNAWLRYAWRRVQQLDSTLWMQMPGIRPSAHFDYQKNQPILQLYNAAAFGQVGTIADIWAEEAKRRRHR